MARKMLAAREDLANKLLEIADRKKVKLFVMLNDTLESALKAEEMGISLADAVSQYGIVKTARETGFVPVVESLWYETLDKLFKMDRDWMMRKWYDSGQWYGKYYSTKVPNHPLKVFKEEISLLTWNISEFSITENKDGGGVVVSCIAPKFLLSQTTLLAAFLEGAFKAFNYELSKKEVSKGIMELSFSRVKSV